MSAAGLQQLRASVPTAVGKGMQISCVIPCNDERYTGYLKCQIVTLVRHLIKASNTDPAVPKKRFDLKLEEAVIPVTAWIE
jgi:hypothetical protein